MNTSKIAIIISVSLIFSVGLLMVFNTTSAEVLDKSLNVSTHSALLKQIIYSICGVGIGIGVYFFGYNNIIRLSPLFLLLCTIGLIAVFIPYIGCEINGAKRWIGLFGYTIQPSEFAKYLIPIYFIYHFSNKKHPKSFKDFIKFLSIFIVPILLILLEPDNGTAAIILTTLVVMFFLCRIKLTYWALPLFLMTVFGSIAAYQMPHVPNRIRVYLHPELDIRGKGHQPYQAKIAAGSGGVFGRGLGESMQKLNYLPEARSDYIAAIYAEEFGFIGMLAMIGAYLFICFGGFYIAVNAKDKEGFYLSIILTFLITFQAFLNLGVVSGLLPSKGIALPFFSQGGTSLIVNIVAIFLILNVASTVKVRKKARI